MIFILTTCKNTKEAKRIATMLLRLRLVACAKWWPIASSYWWEGRIVSAKETALLCEGRKKHWRKIEGTLRRLHRDEIPCIVAWEAARVHASYHRWLHNVTGG